MDVVVIETQNGKQSAVAAKAAAKVAADLAKLERSTKSFEVAHVRDKEHYERITRWIGLAVVVLTATTGTAVMTALAADKSSSLAAKILVGVLSVLSAVFAAVNEKGPFGDQVKAHGDAATGFIKLNRKATVLDRSWATGQIDQAEAQKQLTDLEASYDDLKETSPDLRDYMSAHAFVEGEEKEHGN